MLFVLMGRVYRETCFWVSHTLVVVVVGVLSLVLLSMSGRGSHEVLRSTQAHTRTHTCTQFTEKCVVPEAHESFCFSKRGKSVVFKHSVCPTSPRGPWRGHCERDPPASAPEERSLVQLIFPAQRDSWPRYWPWSCYWPFTLLLTLLQCGG